MKVGSQALISHTYEANNGNLSRSDYGNGDYYVPTYDAIDRLHSVSYNGVESYNWEYGADGRVGLHNDLVNGVTWMYEYANDGSLTSVVGDNGERFVYTYEPSTGKMLTRTVYDGTVSRTTTYNYSDHTNGEKANLIESVVLPTATVTYDYDDFYRASHDVEVNGSDILTTDYTFRNGSAANSTSLMVSSVTNAGNGWSDTLTYTYDANGNIETISQNGTLKATYYYDALNQLIREDNAWLSKSIAYSYDSGGNITLVKEYAYTTGSLDGLTATTSYSYVYGDGNWKDKLTSYNGNTITYDAIGNPISYYNGFTFDWQNGRQLAGVTGNSLTATYKYNSDGIRTSKTVNGVTTEYTLEGSNVVMETNGTDTLWFYYDASGSVTGFELNGTPYFYVKNLQGDIIAITNASGTKVVEYVYDSWGKLISTTGSLASTVGVKNPYRYRGYRYDTETGLYYLQSRYYDPAVKRFVNADVFASTGQGTIGNNMFIYCLNNPITGFDPTGLWDWGVFADIVVTVVATYAAAVTAVFSPVLSVVVFGAVNNSVNAFYYNYFSDGESSIQNKDGVSSYVYDYETRWERLDYAKQETKEETYNLNALRYNGEYSVHMYAWYATGWADNKDIWLFSNLAHRSKRADVDPQKYDEDIIVAIGSYFVGFAGI